MSEEQSSEEMDSVEDEKCDMDIEKQEKEEVTEKQEESDTECVENDEMAMRMFASVWVKVEVEETVEEEPHDLRPSTIKQRNERDREKELMEEDFESRRTKTRNRRKRDPPVKNLQCELCDYKTGYKNCLDLHIMGHNNTKPYNCNFCPYSTKYPTSLQRHIVIQHECKDNEDQLLKLPSYECTECPYKTHFKWNLNAHKRKHSLEKKYKCEHCDYTTAYKHNHLKHNKVHNKDEITYRCDKCPFVTKYEGHISRHLAKIHNEISDRANRCDKCQFSTKTKWRLNIHRNRSRQDSIMKCHYCNFESFFMCEYKEHKISHYNEIRSAKWMDGIKSEAVNGKDIPRDFQNKTETVQPMQEIDFQNQTQHEKDNHYLVDPNCEVEWSSIQVNESLDQDKPFQCTMCNYTAKFKASVQRHFQRHHTSHNRPYKCLNCDFCTKTKDQITLHNKRSKSDETLTCPNCNFSTNFKCQFIMHQRSHYPFKCTACDYTCRQKYDIQKHFATVHLGSGLKCRYCDYKATRKESLLCHEAIHTGNKPYKCNLCDYKSVRRSLLDNHIRRNHCTKNDVTIIDDSKIQSLKVIQEPGDKAKTEQYMLNFCHLSVDGQNHM